MCFATKAVHFEFVFSLSTTAFIYTFDRFIARLGCPEVIYSDCGKNFVGVARHVKELLAFLTHHDDDVYNFCTLHNIQWRFKPPGAPNFDGLWEAAIKSTKTLLKRILHTNSYTFEEYITLFVGIETILSSRPLCSSVGDSSIDYLSPGHFLIGCPLLATPDESPLDCSSYKTCWEHLKQLHQAF